MSRLHFTFGCGSLKLAGTLDTAPGTTGLLIVSGGNEIRSGAFSGHSRLSHRIARAGFPVFRFDRRGIGDSEGENRGFRSSEGDIRAALTAFRAMAPQMERVIGFGNCDAASALMLTGGRGFDALVLSNPWTIDDEAGEQAHAPEALRARYAEKLRNPRELARLLKGRVNLRKLARGLMSSIRPAPSETTLTREIREGLESFDGQTSFLLATGDRTAQMFEAAWDKSDPRIARCNGAGHAYVEPEHREWLEEQLLAALRS